jgi:hypothetical protein
VELEIEKVDCKEKERVKRWERRKERQLLDKGWWGVTDSGCISEFENYDLEEKSSGVIMKENADMNLLIINLS